MAIVHITIPVCMTNENSPQQDNNTVHENDSEAHTQTSRT